MSPIRIFPRHETSVTIALGVRYGQNKIYRLNDCIAEGEQMCGHLLLIVQFMSSVGWIQSDPIVIHPATWEACNDAGRKMVKSVDDGAFESGGKKFTTARYECQEESPPPY